MLSRQQTTQGAAAACCADASKSPRLRRLAAQVDALVETRSQKVFSAFVRGGGARRWICEELNISDAEMTSAIEDLDRRQVEFLPETIDDIAPRTSGRLRAVFEFVKVKLRKKSACSIFASVAACYPQPIEDDASSFPSRTDLAPDMPSAWRLKLPTPPERMVVDRISPTRLDSYLRCPFTFYLRDKGVLGDKRIDYRAAELARWEYGNLAHEALEAFGASPFADSVDADAIAAFLAETVDARLGERFGDKVPGAVVAQGESVKRRLADFAAVQAVRRAAGWRIVAAERRMEIAYGATLVKGKCDRIDYNDSTGEWCVIDYKTWDTAEKARCFETAPDGSRDWKSVQLPLYCAMLAADRSDGFAGASQETTSSCYCVIGKTARDVLFTEPVGGEAVSEAEALARRLVDKIERGVFWPPSPAREWRHDYADWLSPSPEETVDEGWIADQLRRVGGGHG